MQVAAIENGTVIDHIPAEKTYQVAQLLNLKEMSTPVTIGYNLPSKKSGRKALSRWLTSFSRTRKSTALA